MVISFSINPVAIPSLKSISFHSNTILTTVCCQSDTLIPYTPLCVMSISLENLGNKYNVYIFHYLCAIY